MKETIFIVCGLDFGGKRLIANTGFNGGYDYKYRTQTISIYAQPLTINLHLDDMTLSVLSKIKEKFSESCDFDEWDFSGNRAPNFVKDQELTQHICFILNCLCTDYVFSVGNFDPSASKLVFDGDSCGKFFFEIDKCKKIL